MTSLTDACGARDRRAEHMTCLWLVVVLPQDGRRLAVCCTTDSPCTATAAGTAASTTAPTSTAAGPHAEERSSSSSGRVLGRRVPAWAALSG